MKHPNEHGRKSTFFHKYNKRCKVSEILSDEISVKISSVPTERTETPEEALALSIWSPHNNFNLSILRFFWIKSGFYSFFQWSWVGRGLLSGCWVFQSSLHSKSGTSEDSRVRLVISFTFSINVALKKETLQKRRCISMIDIFVLRNSTTTTVHHDHHDWYLIWYLCVEKFYNDHCSSTSKLPWDFSNSLCNAVR